MAVVDSEAVDLAGFGAVVDTSVDWTGFPVAVVELAGFEAAVEVLDSVFEIVVDYVAAGGFLGFDSAEDSGDTAAGSTAVVAAVEVAVAVVGGVADTAAAG